MASSLGDQQHLPEESADTSNPPPNDDETPYESSFNQLLPLKFGKALIINKLSWKDFGGQVDQESPWSAHIYWNIEYSFCCDTKPKVGVSIKLSPRSWVKTENKSPHLLNHEHGHLLIGYLCGLQFLRRMHKSNIEPLFSEYVCNVFQRTLKEFQQMERQYDEETNHRLNLKKQREWDQRIHDRLLYYRETFNAKNNKFGKYKRK